MLIGRCDLWLLISIFQNKQFTIAFGTDDNEETTTFNGTIPQTLMMMNGDLIKQAISIDKGSFLHQVAGDPQPIGRFCGEVARDQVRRLSLLVNDLLDVTHLDTDHFPLRPRRGDLVATVADAVDVFRRGNVRQIARAFPAAPLPATFDAERILQVVLNLENSALTYVTGKQSDKADATITLARATLDAVTLRKTTFPEAVQAGLIRIEGDAGRLVELLGMLDTFNPMFEVVEPKKAAK